MKQARMTNNLIQVTRNVIKFGFRIYTNYLNSQSKNKITTYFKLGFSLLQSV